MATLPWLTVFALLAAAPAENPKASPAQDSVPPTQRAEDRPAHESPYSAFGAPHAKRSVKKRSGKRLHCADGSIQTEGQQKDKSACADHGGLKKP
jgi:hypothetical protein